jgi:pimeloyl-ACP methyl ester carboxylesterase
MALAIGVAVLVLAKPPRLAAPPGVELTPIRTITPIEARLLLTLVGVKGVSVRNSVDCYRMTYAGPDDRFRRQSGLLALPRGAAPRRVAAFLHGTATTRSAVPSKPDGTGLAAAILFAGNGYAMVAPDYPGMGASPGRHPYYVADAIAPAVVAMIAAAQAIDGVPDTPVFLSGFSEGGWATLATLRQLEAEGRPVLGATPVAGAFDLMGLSVPAALKGGAPSHSLYLAYAAWGKAPYLDQRLDSALTPEMAAVAERLFAGAPPQEILDTLPKDPRRMLVPAFLDAADGRGAHWLSESFKANSVHAMTPRTPVRMYFGSNDLDVVPDESRQAAAAMRARGADVTAVDVGPMSHDQTMLAAAPLILAWLAELEVAGVRPAL